LALAVVRQAAGLRRSRFAGGSAFFVRPIAMTHNRYMAFGIMAAALTICWCFAHVCRTISRSDAPGMAVFYAVASIFFSGYLVLCWKRQWVWVRSSRIVRSSDSFSYWLAMSAFGLMDLAFLSALASSIYVLVKSSA